MHRCNVDDALINWYFTQAKQCTKCRFRWSRH